MTEGLTFKGCKIAVICGDALLTLKRDNIPSIPYPNYWDLPGGGREGDESPESCALRELYEEFGLVLDPVDIHYKQCVVSHTGQGSAYFLAIHIDQSELQNINFGNEGQGWELMPIQVFLERSDATPSNQQRLKDYLLSQSSI